MAVTGITRKKVEIVDLGDAYEDFTRKCGADTITEGDLIRINVSNTIDLAEASAAGAVHGIALEDGTEGTRIRVLLFADNTTFIIQCVDSLAPTSLTVGSTYTLEYSSGTVGITSTTSNGVLTVQSVPGSTRDEIPWTISYGGWENFKTTANGEVIVKVKQATLDGFAAAAT